MADASKQPQLSRRIARGLEQVAIVRRKVLFESKFGCGDFEQLLDLLGHLAGATHSVTEIRIIHLAASYLTDSLQNLFGLQRVRSIHPFHENRFDREWQTKHHESSHARTGFSRCRQDSGDLHLVQSWNYRSHHDADGHSGVGQNLDGS